jgi:hypothetical protein
VKYYEANVMLIHAIKKAKHIIDFIILVSGKKESKLWLKIIDMRLNHKHTDLVTIGKRFIDFPNLIDPACPLNWDYLEGRILLSQDRLNAATSWMLKARAENRTAGAIDDMHRQIGDKIREMDERRTSSSGKERYLVIRACGIGFWGEVNHVISQLVFAKWTRRTPYVFWGDECFYHDGSQGNAFLQYFRSWDEDRHSTITNMSRFFPDDYWTRETVFGRGTRMYSFKSPRSYVGLDLLGRDEDVLVVDGYVSLDVLLEWLPEGSEYRGLTIREAYRNIFGQYLRLLPEISDRIDEFWDRTMRGIPFVAVHARGGDRTESMEKLADNDRRYFEKIERGSNVREYILRQKPSSCVPTPSSSMRIFARDTKIVWLPIRLSARRAIKDSIPQGLRRTEGWPGWRPSSKSCSQPAARSSSAAAPM